MQSRRALAVLFSIVVMDLVGFGIVVPVLPYLVTEFGAEGTELGLLVAAYAAMQFVFAPLWGRLSDRIGRRPVMLVTIAGVSGSLLMAGLAPSLAWLFAARFVGGVFAANISVASAYITDVTDPSERTRWMGMLGACFAVGFTLGPAIGGLLGNFGYQVPLLAAAGLTAVNLLWAAAVLREPDRRAGSEREGTTRGVLLGQPQVRKILLANLFFALAVTQLETVFALLMMQRFGFDVMHVAFILIGMAVVMGAIQGGGMRALASRFGERTLLHAGAVLMLVAFALIPLAGSVALLLVPLAISAVGRGICQPSMMSLASSFSTPSTRGVLLGVFNSAASLARVVGPVFAGTLFDLSMGIPFFLASGLMAVMLAFSSGLPARVEEPAPEPAT